MFLSSQGVGDTPCDCNHIAGVVNKAKAVEDSMPCNPGLNVFN